MASCKKKAFHSAPCGAIPKALLKDGSFILIFLV